MASQFISLPIEDNSGHNQLSASRFKTVLGPGVSVSVILPQAGPFADFGVVPVGGLSNHAYRDLDFPNAPINAAATYNHLTFANFTDPISPQIPYNCLAMWCNVITFFPDTMAAKVQGDQGGAGSISSGCGAAHGGNGANGGAGGGGGAATDGDLAACGGIGAACSSPTDNPGADGQETGGTLQGGGGSSNSATYTFAWSSSFLPVPQGGSSGSGTMFGGGAGGYGGDANPTVMGDFSAGGGGGAGGGLIVAVANQIIGNGVTLSAPGGNGGAGDDSMGGGSSGGNGWPGGDGVILIMAKKYGGDLNVSNAVAYLYEIKSDLSLVQHFSFADTWNNL